MSTDDQLVASAKQLSISDSIHDELVFSVPKISSIKHPFDLSSLNEFQIKITSGAEDSMLSMMAITQVMDIKSLSQENSSSSNNTGLPSNDKKDNAIEMYLLAVPLQTIGTLADRKEFSDTCFQMRGEDLMIVIDCKRSYNLHLYEKLKKLSTCAHLLQAGCQVRWYRMEMPGSASNSSTAEAVVALETAFNAPFVVHQDDELSVVKCLDKYLTECRIEWKDGECPYLVLFISIVQSSGSGKTRIIKELHASKMYRVLYVCCRDSNVVSYPKTSACYEWLVSQLRIGVDIVTACRKFVFCLLIAFKETLDQFPDVEMVPMSSDANAYFCQVFNTKVLQNNMSLLLDEAKTAFDELSKGTPVLFVLDEARSLFNLIDKETTRNAFVEIRRILYSTDFIVKSSKLVTIALDTLSTVSNFAPPTTDQSSGRLFGKDKYASKLFQPFYVITSYSVLSYPDFRADKIRQIGSITAKEGKSQLMSLINHKHRHLALLTIGRPLWAATFRAAAKMKDNEAFTSLPDSVERNTNINDGLRSVANVARLKLACGAVEYVDNCCSTNERMFLTSIACLSVVTGMPISGTTAYAKKLMSSHAAWLHYISENRTWLQVGYLQEHALVEQSLLLQENYMDSMLLDLKRASDERLVDAGTKGEWYCTILLVSARHSILMYPPVANTPTEKKSAYSPRIGRRITRQVPISRIAPKVKLSQFLCMLGVPVKCWQDKRLGSLSVNCSHFIQLVALPTENNIRSALIYGHGFMLPPGTRGGDLLVPAVDDDGNISMINVQSKCYSDKTPDKSYYETVIQKLSPKYLWLNKKPNLIEIAKDAKPTHSAHCPFLTATVPYIGILIQFGGGDRKSLKRELVYLSDGSMRACIVVPDHDALPCLEMYQVNHNKKSIKSIILESVRNRQLLHTWKEKSMPMNTFLCRSDEKMPSTFEDISVQSLEASTHLRVLSELI